jgi:NitT/TauT family transport system substrate-binding protein
MDIARLPDAKQSRACGLPSRRLTLIAREPLSIIAPLATHGRSVPMRTSTVVMAAVLLAATSTRPLRAQSEQEVILADPAFSMTFAAGYIATDLGLFAKHGIKVKTVPISGVGSINSVISGSSQFAQASASTFGRASARGQKLVAIAVTINRPFAQLILRKDIATAGGFNAKAPLEKRAALIKGHTIAVDSINSMIHAYVRLLISRAGLKPDDVRIAPMAPPSMLAAFQTKQIDGFAMSLPWPLKPVQDGEALLLASGPDGEPGDMIPFGHNMIIAKQETCEKNKALCMAMGQSFKDATAFIQNKPDEALALLKKRFPQLDDKVLKAGFEELRKVTPSPPAVTKADIENSEIFNVDAGLLKPDEKLTNFDGLFTDEFVK